MGWRPTLLGATLVAVLLALLIWRFVPSGTTAGDGLAHHREGGLLRGLVSVLAAPQSWFCAIFGAGMAVPVLAFAGLWGVPYMMAAYGLARPVAALTTTLMLIGWAIGAPAAGWVSDHLGRRRPVVVVATLGALATLAVALYLPGLPLIAVQGLLLVHGVFSGTMVLSFAVARENNRRAFGATARRLRQHGGDGLERRFPAADRLAARQGVGWAPGGRRARLFAGDFKAALVTLLVAGAVACVAAVLTRETHCRPPADSD